MRTIVSPACSKIAVARSKDRVVWREHSSNNNVGGREVGFFSCKKKHGRVGFLHLIRTTYKGYSPVLSSSQSQAQVETAETENQSSLNESKTVRVRFLLQKECAFGEQFLLVGDDPILGSWDPENAVPLNWSDDHIWVVELDAPVDKSIQYKFLLREITGKVTWQPEPDRIIQTWSTANTIVVSEDWEDAALQNIVEEEPQADQNVEFIGSSEMLVVAENLTYQKKESVHSKSEETTNDDENPYAAYNSSLDSANKQIVVPEKQVAIVADNISYPQQNPAVSATVNVQDQKRISDSKDKPVTTADKNLVPGKEIMASNGRAPVPPESEDVNENLVMHDGGPVLVPGLTPLPPIPSEVAIQDQDESEKSINSDASLGVDEVENHNIPETIQLDDKQVTTDDLIINSNQPEEEKTQMVCDEHHLKSETNHGNGAKQEIKQELPENQESNFFNNDIQWGRQTLQKLLSNLGLL